MAHWKEILAHSAVDVENVFDRLKYGLKERLGSHDPIMILPYRGMGTPEKLYLKGRVLEDEGIRPADDNDTIWDNLLNMYRRFESDEIPYARVRARFGGIEKEVRADEEGYFEVWLEPPQPLEVTSLWQTVELELVAPLRENQPKVHAQGLVLVPPSQARFGVISDIDDTVIETETPHLLRMARIIFLGNARTRLPLKGVACFYRALFEGASGGEQNPLFYVSGSPWNLYDLLSDLFQLHNIPVGPVLFLRDIGISTTEVLPVRHRTHKLQAIRRALDLYQHLPFILLGDSSQEDPEIYQELVELYPQRILAIYIRNVSHDPERPESIYKLAEKVLAAGSTLILADNTVPMAEHAAAQGWISPNKLPEIREDKKKDEQPPNPVEQLLGVEDTQGGDHPPTIVVDGQASSQNKQ